MKAKLISVSVAALMLSACNMAPDMEQRELPVAQNYDIQGTAGDINALNWQSFFSNAQLQQLIALTLENNKDIKTAALNVQQVRAMYQIDLTRKGSAANREQNSQLTMRRLRTQNLQSAERTPVEIGRYINTKDCK